jgi:hypothetical protein
MKTYGEANVLLHHSLNPGTRCRGARCRVVVKVLRYKPEGRGFDT